MDVKRRVAVITENASTVLEIHDQSLNVFSYVCLSVHGDPDMTTACDAVGRSQFIKRDPPPSHPPDMFKIMQGLFVGCIYVGSGDPVRILRLLHNKYAGYT